MFYARLAFPREPIYDWNQRPIWPIAEKKLLCPVSAVGASPPSGLVVVDCQAAQAWARTGSTSNVPSSSDETGVASVKACGATDGVEVTLSKPPAKTASTSVGV